MPNYDMACEKGHLEEVLLGSWSDPNPPCPECGGARERVWSMGVRHVGAMAFPYTTTAFDGKPVVVKSESHLKALCQAHGVTHRPDVAWNEKSYSHMERGRDGQWKAVMKEGSGVGTPGCWI